MLQRQVMFKQLQELQRRQQLQELGDNRNQNFVNQLSSLKHAPVGQFSPTVNGGTPILDSSQMSIFGNMEVMPSGLVLPQNQNPDALSQVGLSLPQFGISSFGNQGPNDGKNFNQYSHLQGPSNLSIDQRIKNHNHLGIANMQLPPFIGNSFMNQQLNFPSDRIHMPDGQAPFEGYNRESLSENYSPQGIPMQGNSSLLESEVGHQDAHWDGFSSGKPSSPGQSESAASLDPLEQKILYGTDDIWESSLNGNLSTGLFQTTGEHTSHMGSLPSIQSGSWSALMQSAVAETSGSDTGMQEHWSGLSFKNQESFNGNQLPNFIENQQLQSNWVDRNLQSAPLPSPGPEHLFHNFPSFQESGHQYGSSNATPELFHGNTGQLMDYSSQQKLPTTGKQLNQRSLSSTVSPDSGFRQQSTDPQAPQAYAFSPKMGNSSKTYLSSNIVSDTENKQPALPVPRPVANEFLAFSAAAALQNSELKIIQSGGREFPQLENNFATQPPSNSDGLQLVVQPTPWPDISTQQEGSDAKPYKFPNLFGFPNPASGSLEETKPPNLEASLCEQELVSYTRKPEGSDQQFKQGNSLPENSSEINNSASLGSTNIHQYKENHCLEAGAVGSDSLRTNMHQQSYSQVGGDSESPSIPPGDGGAFGNSLSENYSHAHQLLPSRNIETDGGHKPGVEDIAKDGPHAVPQLGAFTPSGIRGLNSSQAPGVDELGKSSAVVLNQKQVDTFGQNSTPVHSFGGIEASNIAYPSQMSLHMAPAWINQLSLKARSLLPICESSLVSAEQQLQPNSLTIQVNLAESDPGRGINPPSDVTAICPSMVSTDVTSQKLVFSIPKKRKLTEFSMVSWHKEMAHQPSMPHDISVTELAWAEALNRRAMEVNTQADVFQDYLPKRRLICSTQLTQNVIGPMPTVILWSDASSHSDIMPYSAARLIVGYACNMTGQFLNDTNDISSDKPKASKRRKASEFAKVADGLDNRAEKLKADFERLSRSYYAAMRCEGQELEKFSIINRFAKTHIKALTSAVDPATSSTSSPALPRTSLQRYVVAVPMPNILPEGVDCLSL